MNSAKKRSFDWRGLVSSSGGACLLSVSSSVSSSGGACLLSVSSRRVAFRQVEGRVSSAFRREE